MSKIRAIILFLTGILQKAISDKNPGYEVYDWNGKQACPKR